MSHWSDSVGAAVRWLALVCVVAGSAAILRGPVARSTEVIPWPSVDMPAFTAAEPSAVAGWALGTDGWVIRVDGASVPLPNLVEQMRSHPRAAVRLEISPYDDLIVSHARAQGFDWRLVAALMFEESRFVPDVGSSKGAYGLMQVRAIAAESVGEERYHEPEDNIRTGIRYLRHLDRRFRDVRITDRLSFVLAAYHMGPSHVRDAQELARRFGYDPHRWEGGVALVVPLLEQPAIHRTLPNGYAKGALTVRYVERILARYEAYRSRRPELSDQEVQPETGDEASRPEPSANG